jgi:hypothetical protein
MSMLLMNTTGLESAGSEQDIGSMLSKKLSYSLADAARRAGDNRDLSSKPHVVLPRTQSEIWAVSVCRASTPEIELRLIGWTYFLDDSGWVHPLRSKQIDGLKVIIEPVKDTMEC